jgi:hypothetical protein
MGIDSLGWDFRVLLEIFRKVIFVESELAAFIMLQQVEELNNKGTRVEINYDSVLKPRRLAGSDYE